MTLIQTPIQTPDWVKHAVFYQIFPDRFARGTDPSDALPQTAIALEAWDAPPTNEGYKGGNLWGVIDKLPYLQDLGITAIYLTPIFQSASNHRYHTHDYYQVDPLLGGNIALRKLIDAAHDRQIKIVLDGVFNHASRGFFQFNDILEHGPHSPWIDWFRIQGWPLSAYDGAKPANYVSWVNNRALPQFNHDNPDVREYIMRIGEHWIREGIDGWRLDVPFEVKAPGFWQEFRDRIKAINPEAYIVGEVWSDAARWLDGTAFDGVMNYEFTGPAIAFAAGDRVQREMVEHHDYWPYPALDAPGYAAKLDRLFGLYDWSIHLAQLNLLDSHDTPRLLTLAGGDRDSLKLALFLMFTFPGAPCIYYGDEVGLAGAHDPDCRRSFPAPEHWDRSLLDLCRELITLRQRFAALRTGDYRTIYAHDSVYAFERNDASDRLVGCVNVDITPASIPIADLSLTASAIHPPLFGTADLGSDHITLPARSFCVLHRNPSA